MIKEVKYKVRISGKSDRRPIDSPPKAARFSSMTILQASKSSITDEGLNDIMPLPLSAPPTTEAAFTRMRNMLSAIMGKSAINARRIQSIRMPE